MINYQNSFNDKLTHGCSSRTYSCIKLNTLFDSQQTTTDYIKKSNLKYFSLSTGTIRDSTFSHFLSGLHYTPTASPPKPQQHATPKKQITKKNLTKGTSVLPHSAICFGTIAAQQLFFFFFLFWWCRRWHTVCGHSRDDLPGGEGVRAAIEPGRQRGGTQRTVRRTGTHRRRSWFQNQNRKPMEACQNSTWRFQYFHKGSLGWVFAKRTLFKKGQSTPKSKTVFS